MLAGIHGQSSTIVSSSTIINTPADDDGLRQAELERALTRLQAGIIRGAVIGCTLRGGLHLVGSLLAAASKRKRRSVTAAGAVEDTLRYAAFLAALAGTYIGVDEGIAAILGKSRSARWRSLVAGVCAGPALLLTGAKVRHNSLATYILLRGITLLIRVGNKQRNRQHHPWLWHLLAPTRLQHGDTLMMCLSCSQIIYAFIFAPQTLPTSYVRFIQKQGAKELYIWQGIRELAERTSLGQTPGPLMSLMGTCHADSHAALPCGFFHPNQSCLQHPLQLLLPAYSRALSVYLPVYVLPALLVHRQQVLKQPLPILQKVLLGMARSSLFLSSFICLAFGGACLGHHLMGRSTGLIIAGSTWVGGLATLVEKKSRRMELALYVLSRSLESFSRCCLDWGWLPAGCVPPRLDVLLFAAGVGAILHCYSGSNGRHRDVFKSKYLNVLDFVFGNTGFSEGSIQHHPSNHDLLNIVTQTVSLHVRSLSHGNLQAARCRSASVDIGLDSVAEWPLQITPRAGVDAACSTSSSSCWQQDAGVGNSTGGVTATAAAAVSVLTALGDDVASRHADRRRSSSWPGNGHPRRVDAVTGMLAETKTWDPAQLQQHAVGGSSSSSSSSSPG